MLLSERAGRRNASTRLFRMFLSTVMTTSLASAVVAVGFTGGVAHAAPEPQAFIVSGTGNGHGRGLSQWGAYGRAVNGGQSWQTILDAYYGGTANGTASNSTLGVRLRKLDDATTLGVTASQRSVKWSSSAQSPADTYSGIYAQEMQPNVFDVYGITDRTACPGGVQFDLPDGTYSTSSPVSPEVETIQQFLNAYGFDAGPVDGDFGPRTEAAVKRFQESSELNQTGIWSAPEKAAAEALMASAPTTSWTQLATGVTGPITFTSTLNSATAPAVDTLGVCGSDGSVIHYRGEVRFVDTADGNRVVNRVPIESYLRGVIPKEVYASWGSAADGRGMNALQAQAVAARSFALSQNRYDYAETCDTASCQVYGGAAKRTAVNSEPTVVETANTDTSISTTAGVVRVWPDGKIASTEFSDSNGPRTAGGAFPPVDDPYDDVSGNNNHTWTRTLTAAQVRDEYSLSTAVDVATEPDPDSEFDGIWANRVRLTADTTVSAWDFRNAFGLPSPGFTLRPDFPVTCVPVAFDTLAMIGDSVGAQVAGEANSPLRSKLDGKFATSWFDSLDSRATVGGSVEDGVTAAARVPEGTELVVVELGYNDDADQLGTRIDAMMDALKARSVGTVLWVNLSEIRPEYAPANVALAEAQTRHSNLRVLDWSSASMARTGWFADGVHLTSSGMTAFAGFITQEIARTAGIENGKCLSWQTARLSAGQTLEVPVLGRAGVPAALADIDAVSLNITAVAADAPGHLTVWECGTDQPHTASVNYPARSATPNAVVLPLALTGKVCIRSHAAADVVVDISGWFDSSSGVEVSSGRLFDSRQSQPVPAGGVQKVQVLGRFGVPTSAADIQGVSLNVTAVLARAPGHLTVWECGQDMPPTASLNYAPDRTSGNAVVIPLGGSGEICIRSHATTDVVVDISGWYDKAADVHTSNRRLYDSRRSGGKLAAGETRTVPLAAATEGTTLDVAGMVLNPVAVNPSGPGHVTQWRCGTPKPHVASLNYEAGRTVPNMAILAAASTDSACYASFAETDLVVDVSAVFGSKSGLRSAAARVIDTRTAVG